MEAAVAGLGVGVHGAHATKGTNQDERKEMPQQEQEERRPDVLIPLTPQADAFNRSTSLLFTTKVTSQVCRLLLNEPPLRITGGLNAHVPQHLMKNAWTGPEFHLC